MVQIYPEILAYFPFVQLPGTGNSLTRSGLLLITLERNFKENILEYYIKNY